MIEKLLTLSQNLVNEVSLHTVRPVLSVIDPVKKGPLALIGERGVGKTTLVLQYLKTYIGKGVYISGDSGYIQDLFDLTFQLVQEHSIDCLVVDEIHALTDRSRHVKNIIDSFPKLHVIVLGSSSLLLHKGTIDLQRRIFPIHIYPLNFSEFLKFKYKIDLPTITFSQLISDHIQISAEYYSQITKKMIQEYVEYGHYPYTLDREFGAYQLMANTNKKIVYEDLSHLINFNSGALHKIEQLFWYIAVTPPSDISYTVLAKKTGLSIKLLEQVIVTLADIGVLNLAVRSNKTSDIMRKQFKVFLGNSCLYYAYTDTPLIGSVRESFVMHHLRKVGAGSRDPYQLLLPQYGDILFQKGLDSYLFEVGGANKTDKQIGKDKKCFVVNADRLVGEGNHIPMWMFGLLE